MSRDVQVRSEETGLNYFLTVREAFAAAEADPTIWKISFSLPSGRRVRLVRTPDGFVEEDIDLSAWQGERRQG